MSDQFDSHITINCLLSKGIHGLSGDGCVYEMSTSQQQVLSPNKLRVGEYVKIRLWLPGYTAHVFIELAEIRWIKHPWINIEILVISATDQQRIKRFTELQAQLSQSSHIDSKHILIRA